MPDTIRGSKVHDVINAKLIELVPEMDSEFGLTPMQFRAWKEPSDTLDNKEPCFIHSETDQGLKKDYIFSGKNRGMKAEDVGYYHLLTREGQVLAYRRVLSEGPSFWSRCCSCGNRHQDFYQVRRLMYNRTICLEPDDLVAARMRLTGAQSGADAGARFGQSSYLPVLTSALLLRA